VNADACLDNGTQPLLVQTKDLPFLFSSEGTGIMELVLSNDGLYQLIIPFPDTVATTLLREV
jgi:hypothetical protein